MFLLSKVMTSPNDKTLPVMHVLRVKRVREKYEAELRELECSERSAVEKQQELRKQQMETEGELIRLQAAVRHREQEVEEITQVSYRSLTFGKSGCIKAQHSFEKVNGLSLQARDKLASERRSLAEVIRQEFADRLVMTEEESRRLKVDVSEVRARLRLEVERLTREKEEELAEVHQR